MREVKFPKIALTLTGRDEEGNVTEVAVPQTAQDLLLQALNVFRDGHGQPVGPTMKEIEERLPLRAKISDGKGSVLLETDEWALLCRVIKPHRWPWTHEDVLKVCHAVTEAEEVEVEAKAKVEEAKVEEAKPKPNREQRRRKRRA